MRNVVKLSDRAKPVTPFDEFWSLYPKKMGKGYARKCYAKALEIASAEEINAGAVRFANYVEQSNTEYRYIPMASTWLNGERWEDEMPEEDSGWGDMDGF